MSKQLERLYYGAKGFVRNKLHYNPFEHSYTKTYGKVPYIGVDEMNLAIKEAILAGEPLMVCRFGGFEMFAMKSAEFDERERMEEAVGFMDRSAGFFPADKELLYRFNELMKRDCREADFMGCWLMNYEDYYIRKYCTGMKSVGKLMSIEPWNVMDDPWTAALADKRVLVIHPFEQTIRAQYQKRGSLFENPDVLPKFTLLTLKAVQTSGGASDSRFETWFDALDYMCRECEKIDFDVALIGCGAYGFPLAAHIKRMGKQAVHLGGVLQILFGIKGRRWDESDTHLMYNENWVYPDKSEVPKDAEKVENACYWEVKKEQEEEKQENGK